MRKGDARRQVIVQTAERLFYERGYESTSVQDIIDELGFSKGGFYHHFESKLSLLEAICDERARRSYALGERAVDECPGPASEKLNALFRRATILQTDSADFISLLLRVAYREDGALMREKMKQRQLELNVPLVDRVVSAGIASGEFFSLFPAQIGELVLRLCMQLTDEIAFMLTKCRQNAEVLVLIFEKLKVYRHAIETLLYAPHGSIVIYQLSEMEEICLEMLHRNARQGINSIRR